MSSNSGYNTNPSGGVEPNFFNLSNDRDKKKNTTSDVDENAYWATSPPPYTPTSTSSEPSAPPLDPEYRQQQQYPPQGYNQYPQYGSTIQTPNSTATNWPWRAPPPAANNNNGTPHTLPPGIPPYEVASAEPSRTNKKCNNLIFCFIPLFIFLFFTQIFNSSINVCNDGIHWDSLPKRFDFDSKGLTFRVTGGQVTSGTVQFRREQNKSGIVEVDAVLYPHQLLEDPQLNYNFVKGKDGTTHLEITFPSSALMSNSHCISLNAVIYLPYDTPLQFLNLEMKNIKFETDQEETMDVEHLVLQSTNSHILFNSRWHGKTLLLETSNARIDVTQPIESDDSVILETKNGRIHLGETIQAKNSISLSTTNAAIDAEKLLSTAKLSATTSNGPVNLNRVKVDRSDIKASNGHITVKGGDVATLFHTQTSNGKLDVSLDNCTLCQVIAVTSNANLKLILPENHEGPFDAITSNYNSIKFNDRLDWSKLHFRQQGRVYGERYRPDNYNHNGGSVQTQTSNGNIYFSFGKE